MIKKRFDRYDSTTIEDISNDLDVKEIIGIFKRVEAKRIRAFEDEYDERYAFNKVLYTDQDDYEL